MLTPGEQTALTNMTPEKRLSYYAEQAERFRRAHTLLIELYNLGAAVGDPSMLWMMIGRAEVEAGRYETLVKSVELKEVS